MSHHFESGFCVRQPSWHGLENLLTDYPEDWDAARVAAGLTWDPVSKPVYVEHVEMVPVGVGPVHEGRVTQRVDWTPPSGAVVVKEPTLADPFARYMIQAPHNQAIVRNDTGAVLGVPSAGYAIVDNGEMGHIVEAILDEGALFETAGSVRGGKQVYCLALLDEPMQVNGDPSPSLPYLAVLNSHDGGGAVRVVLTQVRVVCANTFQMASDDADRSGMSVSLRHTGDVADRIEEAKQMLSMARAGSAHWVEEMNRLADVSIDDRLLTRFLDGFIPIPEGASERTVTARQQRRGEFLGIYRDSPTTDGIRGTGYGLYQTVGEYLDHYRPHRSADTYLSRTMFDTPTEKARSLARVKRLVLAGSEA